MPLVEREEQLAGSGSSRSQQRQRLVRGVLQQPAVRRHLPPRVGDLRDGV